MTARAPLVESVLPGPELRALLAAAGLPVADLSWRMRFLGVREAARLAACIGLEPHGEVALLRSLAVAPEFRGRGLGRALLRRAEHEAVATGVGTLYLLTDTAAGYFSRHDYVPAERADAPPAIRSTAQFSGLCPASASLLCKRLSAAPEVQQQ